jgi:hypothetical protein
MGARTFGLRECTDFREMVEKLEVYFRAQPGLPDHLYDTKHLNEWKVWAGSHNVFASYWHKLRRATEPVPGDPRHVPRRRLAAEFDAIMARGFPRYLLKALTSKVRTALGLPDQTPLLARARSGLRLG